MINLQNKQDLTSQQCEAISPSIQRLDELKKCEKIDSEIRVNVKLDLENFTKAANEWMLNRYFVIWPPIFIMAIETVSFSIYLYNRSENMPFSFYDTPPLMFVLSSILLFLIYGFMRKFVLRLEFQMLKDFQKSPIYTLSNDGFELTNEQASSRISWRALTKAVETKNNFIFFVSWKEFHFIPKKFFKRQEDIKILRFVLKSNLGTKAKLSTDYYTL